MISCAYCDGYIEEGILKCPFEEVYEDFVAATFETPYIVTMPDRFVLTNILVNGYADEVLLFSLNIKNQEYISYFGHDIKIDTYRNIYKGVISLTKDIAFVKAFPPEICFYAHGIELNF